MGIIKKNVREQNQPENTNIPNQKTNSKILGNIIKQDFLGKELISLDISNEKISKKIIKKEEVALPINQVIEEIKDVNLVSKSSIEFELEEEKKKYQKLNEELEQKINEQKQKIEEIEKQKKIIIEEAQKQAEKIIQEAINQAQKKAKEILDQAVNEGFQKGYQEAQEQVNNIYQQKILQIQQEINNVINIRQELIKEFEKEIVELAFQIAEKIINKKIQEEQSVVTSYLADLLAKVERSKSITIWVNPQELED
ncbi:MAG: FliH/SctL family protein, partial [Candidatus Micrarchaeia archaeon]